MSDITQVPSTMIEVADRGGRTLRIIGSQKSVDKMRILGSAYPAPTEAVS